MSLHRPIGRLALSTLFVVAAFYFGHDAEAQPDAPGMPGMSPPALPSPGPAAASATPPSPTPIPSSATPRGMEAMPGMAPASSPETNANGPARAKKATVGMDGMPGMKTRGQAQKKDMKGMPGMEPKPDSQQKGKGAMPGMSGDAPAAQRMSAPGVFVLRPPQKWTPPPGDDRSGELLTREQLREHMQPLPPVEDSTLHYFSLFDLLEYRYNSSGPDLFVWDFNGWYGGDYNRLWVKTEGRQTLSQNNRSEGDLQLLYGRLIAPFWDFQIGARAKQNLISDFHGNTRTYAVIGFQGLAPGNFDMEPALYISDCGEVSGELTLSADLYLTQHLILQPRFQGEVTAQGDPRFETGRGGTEIDMGVRLRYDVRREFQPYVGVSWLRSFGANERIARQAGESYDRIGFVAGLQLWW